MLPRDAVQAYPSLSSWPPRLCPPSIYISDFTVKVTNLPPNVTEKELSDHFRMILGREVVEASMQRGRTWAAVRSLGIIFLSPLHTALVL